MNIVPIIELTLACIIFVIYIGELIVKSNIESDRRLRLCLLLSVIWLVSDGLAYLLLGPEYPFAFRYILNLFAYTFGCVVMFFFIRYRDAYIREKTELNPWLYRVPMIIILVACLLAFYEYFAGHIIHYENGIATEVYGIPLYITIMQTIVMLYLPFVAFSKRKEIGMLPVVMFGIFDILPIVSLFIAIILKLELTVVFAGVEITAILVILQRKRAREYDVRDATRQILADNNARIMALEDNFESLYDVDLETGEYEVYVKGQDFYDNVTSKLVDNREFFKDTIMNAENVVYPEDKEDFLRVATREFLTDVLSKASYYDHYYRLVIDDKPSWFKMRFVYKDDKKTHVIFGIFNAEEEVEKREEEERKKNELISRFAGTESTYIVNVKNDTFTVINRNKYLKENYDRYKSYSESINIYIEKDIYVEDRESVRDKFSLEFLSKLIENDSECTFRYRDISAKGFPQWYECKAFKFSDDEILHSFSNKHNEIIDELLFNRFRDTYIGLYYTNLNTGLTQIIKSGHEDITGKAGEVVEYNKLIKNLQTLTAGEAVAFFDKISDTKYIKERFRNLDTSYYTFVTKTLHTGSKESAWVNVAGRVITRDENGEVLTYALGFTQLDDLSSKKEEASIKLKDTLMKLDNEVRRSELFFDTFNAGKWTYEINDNDEIINARYSDNVHKNAHTILSEEPMGWVQNIHPEDRERVVSEFLAPIYDHSGKTKYDTVFRVLTKDGEIVWNKSAGSVIIDADGKREYYGMTTDLTQQMAEQERHKLELSKALEAAKEADVAKTEFLFNMSHDIRTPMNAIIGFTNLAKKQAKDEKLLDYLGKTEEASGLLLTLINSILDMSRIESGKVILEETPGDVRFSFESIEGTMREIAKTKNIDISFEYGDITDYYVYADYERCLRIFVNIISNAIKYTKDGGWVKVKCEQIGKREDGYGIYQYTFEDNGIGMSEEFQKHVYEYFSREENSTTRGIQGTGIGLSVCKSFVDLMHGSITCRSKQGVGTKFIVTLPFKIQDGNGRRQYIDPESKLPVYVDVNEKDFIGKKVLLVEDNAMNLEIAQEILKERGLIVEVATDGTIAVDLVRKNGPDYYDFILMDIQMPIMGGYEATEAIRLMYPDSKLPIIALSANAFKEDREASLKAGMNEHIAKPINVGELFNVLSNFL